MNKAVFLDKDGTLVVDVPYNADIQKVRISDHCLEGLVEMRRAGFKLVVISNQSGIAKGYFSEFDFQVMRLGIFEMFEEAGAPIDDFYYCPHHHQGTVLPYAVACECRKPKPGMILNAARDHQINLHQSWMVGDILNDIEAGNLAGCQTILINNGNETEWNFNPFNKPAYYACNINAAAEIILKSANYEITVS